MATRKAKIPTRKPRTGEHRSVVVTESGPRAKRGSVAVDPLHVKIAVVSEALGSKSKAAEFLGVARSQPGKWLSGAERPHERARRQIHDFDYVWHRLTDERSPEAAHIWLTSANAFLHGATPLTWLKTRSAEEVVTAIDAEESGSFA
jgi:hypothetical protein